MLWQVRVLPRTRERIIVVEAGRLGQDLPRPAFPTEARATEDPDVARVRTALLAGITADLSRRTGDQQGQVLLAGLLDWHRREAQPAWWRYFYARTLGADDLISEPDAIGGLTGGDVVDQVKRSIVRRFFFHRRNTDSPQGDTAFGTWLQSWAWPTGSLIGRVPPP